MSTASRAASVPIELRPFFVRDVRFTGAELGVGSYGSVEEVEIQGATCVVKRLHEELLPEATEAHGADHMIATFVKECRLMSGLRHPHIVQFLGVCYPPGEARLPALLMEKLMTDLHTFLEKNKDIPLSMKRNVLVDVARGLSYLHSCSPPVIHRDLTARNVLLNSAMVAKIADLGNSRIINVGLEHLMTMTKNPGNVCYMPPEALEEHSQYNKTIDIFSFGNLTLFTLTEKFPKVKNATYVHQTTRRLTARTEIERRNESMDKIIQEFGGSSPLVQLAESCLQDDPRNRPSVVALLQHLERASLVPYRSWEANKLEMVKDIVTKERQVDILQQQALQSKDLLSSSEREHSLEMRVQEAERRVQTEYERRREAEENTFHLQELADTFERRERAAIAGAAAREEPYAKQLRVLQRSLEDANARAQQYQSQAQETKKRLDDATARVKQLERRGSAGRNPREELDSQWVVQPSEVVLTGTELGHGLSVCIEVATFRGTRVAAKRLYDVAITQYNIDHFRHEMLIASVIRHPNLVQFIGATMQGSQYIILSELMTCSLRTLLVREGATFTSHHSLTFTIINSISLDIVRALNYLHLMQPHAIVHRDLSSANVLVEPGPKNSWRAKVSGYQNMKFLNEIRKDNTRPGSSVYAAPEAETPGQQSPKMDIFSFGIVLIEICTADFPNPEILKRRSQLESIPQSNKALILDCTKERPDERPSASDLVTEFQKRCPSV